MFRLLSICFALSACASPALEFKGGQKSTLSVDGDEITVFYTDNRAQAVRTNFRTKTQQKGATARLRFAIEKVTNCVVDTATIEGSVSIIAADIKCSR